jgi:superoxide dismutase, Cu-Zn family
MPFLRPSFLLSAPFLLMSCASTGEGGGASNVASNPARTATATLLAADGSARGSVQAMEGTDGIRLVINGENLPAGSHGVHVHMTGACNPPDFASAGAHWNPAGKQHGRNNPQGMHLGDLPNLLIGTDGRGSLEISIPEARLTGGEKAMLDADGAALVIHASPDDLMTDPSGNSGGRIACGVFAMG